VAEWFRQGPAKPRTAVRFRSPPLRHPGVNVIGAVALYKGVIRSDVDW
jgi:hypothetical protein